MFDCTRGVIFLGPGDSFRCEGEFGLGVISGASGSEIGIEGGFWYAMENVNVMFGLKLLTLKVNKAK